MDDRQTVSKPAELIADPQQRAETEAENALLQFDRVLDLIDEAVRDKRPFRLRPSTVSMLQGVAMRGVHPQAGTFRNTSVKIAGSNHQPPAEHLVGFRVEEMCDWVNDHWVEKSALELCSYIMWRLNWIHSFADGNGRTTRAVAYLVLCVRAGARLPGAPTIPEQIAENKKPYYSALEAADQSDNVDKPDLGAMLDLVQNYLKLQLDGAFAAASETSLSPNASRKFH